MSNTTLVAHLFAECDETSTDTLCDSSMGYLLTHLFISFVISGFLMLITFGIRIPGGIFIPSMIVGATMGRMMGILLQHIASDYPFLFSNACEKGSCIIPGVYALIGAAATLSGVTRMTVSLTIIMFEVTGALSYVLPLMMSIMVAKWVGDAFGKDSVYDKIIQEQGYPYMDHKRTLIPVAATAENLMTDDSTLVYESIYDIEELQEQMIRLQQAYPANDGGFPIVTCSGVLMGYIAQTDLQHAILQLQEQGVDKVCFNMDHQDVKDLWHWVDKAPIACSVSTSAEMVLELFLKLGIRTVLVVQGGQLKGVIHKKRMLLFMRKALSP